MENTKNDKQDPTLMDGQSAEGAGLSSAMHDIRRLAARYESENGDMQADDSLRLGGVTTMQPQHILQPRESNTPDRWKGPALLLLMLLGLSTSAMALALYAEPDTLVEPVFFETENLGHVESPAFTPSPKVELPKEDPAHEASASDFSSEAISPSTVAKSARISRAAITPRVTTRRASSSDGQEALTCDEVSCLIDSSDPCCSQYPSVSQQQSQLEDHNPYRPTRSTIMKAMRGIEDDVLRCFDTHRETGLASVDFVIHTDGSIREVDVSQGPLAFRACVRTHMTTLRFGPLSAPFSMSFPFRK